MLKGSWCSKNSSEWQGPFGRMTLAPIKPVPTPFCRRDKKSERSNVVNFLKKAGADYTVGYDNSWLSSAFLKGTEDETGAPPIPQAFALSCEGRVIDHL